MNDKALLAGAAALAGLGIYMMSKSKPKPVPTTALWKVGDKLKLTFTINYTYIGEAFVQVTAVRWNDGYKGWEYSLYDLCTSMQYGDYYLEIQLVEWYARPVRPDDQCPG